MLKKIAILFLAIIMVLSTPLVAFADVGDNKYDETEPNNYMSSAKRIYSDSTVTGNLNGSDMDYFKFTLSSRSKVEFLAMAGYSYLLAGILDSSEEFVAAGNGYYDDGNYWDSFSVTLSAGTYYLVLFPDSASNYYYKINYTFYFNYTSVTTHTHSYTLSVTAPTCTAQGYTTYTCSCGDSYKTNYTSAYGHNAGNAVITNKIDATCSYEGSYDSVSYCTVCGTTISSQKGISIPIDKNAHEYDDVNDTHCNLCGIERPKFRYGDINGDGVINNKDAGILMLYINNWGVAIVKEAADVNCDNVVNNKDYGLLMQYINKWPVELGGSQENSGGNNKPNTDQEFKNWSNSELITLKNVSEDISDVIIDLYVNASSIPVFIGNSLFASMTKTYIADANKELNTIINNLNSIKSSVEANKDLSFTDLDGKVYYLKDTFAKALDYATSMQNLNLSINSSVSTAEQYSTLANELNFYCMVLADIAKANTK